MTLASDLGMETTAEGVEQQDEIALIHDLGCSHIQGFVYGRACANEALLADLAEHGLQAMPVGYKISREPREKVLLRARVLRNGMAIEAVVRNVSARGALIESALMSSSDIGIEVLVELMEGKPWLGVVRWVNEGRVGVEFCTHRPS